MLTGQILLELIVILLVVQICGVLCRRVGQQWVIGEILAGLALGPSLIGALWPQVQNFIFPASSLSTLQTLGDIGLVLYMFSLGARLDTHLMLNQSRKAVATSLSGIALPLSLGFLLAFFLYPGLAGDKATPFPFMLMVGTAMAITAFPVLARLLSEKHMVNTRIGTLALSCAAVDDVAAWCLLALIVAIVHARGLSSVLLTLVELGLFVTAMFALVRPLLLSADRFIRSPQLLILLTIVLLLGSAYFTNSIGIHPIFGAFVMGVILPRRTRFVSYIRSIDQVNSVLFLPLFFVYSGLRTHIGLINTPALWLLCLLILAIACVGKIGGGMFAVRWMGEPWKDSLGLGVLMNTRGLVELIVLNIGLDLGMLSAPLFAMLVIMALVTTMMASPLLRLLGYRQQTPPVDPLDMPQPQDEATQEQMLPNVDS
jgi:Kef-type K+ transport system membrane component KefB